MKRRTKEQMQKAINKAKDLVQSSGMSVGEACEKAKIFPQQYYQAMKKEDSSIKTKKSHIKTYYFEFNHVSSTLEKYELHLRNAADSARFFGDDDYAKTLENQINLLDRFFKELVVVLK